MTVFAPAIITGIRKGAKWGLAIFSMTFMWLMLLLGIVGFYYFFLTSTGDKGYIGLPDLPLPNELPVPMMKPLLEALPNVSLQQEEIPVPSTESLE